MRGTTDKLALCPRLIIYVPSMELRYNRLLLMESVSSRFLAGSIDRKSVV